MKARIIVSEEQKRKLLEEELRSNEARYQLLIEHAPDAIVVYDVDLDRFVEANASAEKLFGCCRDELLHSSPQRFYPPEQPDQREVDDRFSEHNERVLAGEEVLFERTIRSAAGKDLLCEVRLVRLPYGNRRLIRASLIDITERKRTEKNLVESERRFRTLFEQATVGVAEIDPVSGRFIHVNKRYCDIVGLSLDEMLKTDFQSITHPDDLEADLKNMKSIIAGEINEFSMEKRYIKKDGGTVWVNLTVYPTWLSGENPTHHIAIVDDITERKQAEELRRIRETYFSQVFDTVHDIIFVVGIEPDDNFRFISVNRMFLEATGLSDNQVVGKAVRDVIPEPSYSLVLEKYLEAVRSGLSVHWEEVSSYPTGIKFGQVTVTPVFDAANKCTQLIGTVHDITDLKRAQEKLEQKVIERTRELSEANIRLTELDRLKSMFIASMSHELRTPLNSIIGFTGMTLQGLSGELNDEQKDNISRVYQSAKHLLSLISDIIDISKIEAGRIDVFPEALSLKEVIAEAVNTVKPQLKEKGLALEVDTADVRLNTDKMRLLQCILNFLSNAIKYTESGTITVAARETDGQAEISVSDTGIGIAAKDMPKLFEAFERLETHLRVKTGGTGLGLYLTQKLAKDILHGDVSVQTKEGQGSTFTLRVPKDSQQNFDIADKPDKTGDIG